MSTVLDRSSSPPSTPSSTLAPAGPDAPPVDDSDIRDGVRKAHGFALTDSNIVRAVDNTIRVADHVLRLAEMASAAGKEPAPPPSETFPRTSTDRIEPVAPSRALVAVMPDPPLAARESSAWRSLKPVDIALAVATSAAIALVIAVNPLSVRPTSEPPRTGAPAFPPPAATAAVRPPVATTRSAPQLVVTKTEAGSADEELGLGVSIRDPDQGGDVIVSGLPDGAALSRGERNGAGEWAIAASEIGDASVRPPHGFAGTMDLAIAWRAAPDRIAERRSVRLEWARMAASEPLAPAPAAAAPPAPKTAAAEPRATAIPGFTPRKLDGDEIASLIKRGEDLFVLGDVASARLMLQRAAEAGDAHAALALAATYDPIMLNDLGVQGVAPDLKLARAWYEKAKTFGSPDAPRRLELLASRH